MRTRVAVVLVLVVLATVGCGQPGVAPVGAGGAGAVSEPGLVGDWYPCLDPRCTSVDMYYGGLRFTADGRCLELGVPSEETEYCIAEAEMTCSHDGTTITYAYADEEESTDDLLVNGDVLQIEDQETGYFWFYRRLQGTSLGPCVPYGEPCQRGGQCLDGYCACQGDSCEPLCGG